MVQRKVANKSGIKPHLHILDTQLLVNHKPSSPSSSSSLPSPSSTSSTQAHDKHKKIMKKSRSIKRADDSRSLALVKTKKTPPTTPQKQSEHLQHIHFKTHTNTPNASPFKRAPNYMKSTSSFEARKEQSPSPSPKTTPIKKSSKSLKTNELSSGIKGPRTTSLKVRSLTKTSSFKPLRSSKKVIICEDVDSQRATCSSTLKDSKFPDYLQLNDGGTELDGTSAMKVCPYTYCSLNGHHHEPVPPLKCFLSARRRALKTQKGFKLGCLSPRQNKPTVKKSTVKEAAIVAQKEVDMDDKDFFIDICSAKRVPILAEMKGKDACIRPKQAVKESSFEEPMIVTPEEVDMEDKDLFIDNYSDERGQPLAEMQGKDACIMPELTGPHTCESLVHQVYSDGKGNKGSQDMECSDMEWEEGYRSDSDGFKLQDIDGGFGEDQTEKTLVEKLDDEYQELYDEESVSSGAWSEEDCDSASDSSCQHLKTNQDYMKYDESEVSSTSSESDINDKMDQNINYEQEHTSKESTTVPDFAEKLSNESDTNRTTIIYNIIQFNISVFINGEKTEHSVQVPATSVAADKMETEEALEEQDMSNEHDEANEVNQIVADEELSFDVQDIASAEQSEAIEKQDNPEQDGIISETDAKADSSGKKSALVEEQPDTCVNLRDLTGVKKPREEIGDDSREFNPRGPNFLPETPELDAETVDLRHQTIDERKNAEEFMVDFALQQAVTTLAPARKRKVALLVEAFEKVMPDTVPVRDPVRIPGYEPHNRNTSKAFTNSRPMQACS